MPLPLSLTDAPPETLLRVYLSDHLAGAVAGLALAYRCRRNNRDHPVGDALGELIPQIEEDRDTLAGLMRSLGVPGSQGKRVAAAAAERVGRLKLNGQLLGYSDLSRLVELEGLSAGVETKERLWRSLRAAHGHPALHGVDLDRMIERADQQRDRLEELRVDAARTAFGGADGLAGPA